MGQGEKEEVGRDIRPVLQVPSSSCGPKQEADPPHGAAIPPTNAIPLRTSEQELLLFLHNNSTMISGPWDTAQSLQVPGKSLLTNFSPYSSDW